MDKAADVIFNMETKLLSEVLKIVSAGINKKNIDIAEWKLTKLKEVGNITGVTEQIIKEDINKAIEIAQKEIRKTGIDSARKIDIDLKGHSSRLVDALPVTADPRLIAVWERFERPARDELQRLGALLMSKVNESMIDIIEQSTAEVLAGQPTLRDAMRSRSKKWGQQGFKPMIDKAGRQWTSEGYSQMVIRSQIRQVVTVTQTERLDELDWDLIEISSHAGARPLCADWQRKILSLHGKTEGYTKLDDTSYGEPAGLFGINCSHVMYPSIPGVKPTFSEDPAKDRGLDNDKIYKEQQKQRYLEREIRRAERVLQIEKSIPENQENVRKARSRMEDFIKQTGRTRREDREEIY